MMRHLRRVLIAGFGALAFSASAQDIPATVKWDRRVELALPVSGVVEKVHVLPGAMVEKGAALVSLNPAPFNARIAGAKARVAGLEPTLAEARRELERSQDLYDRTVLSGHELQVSKIQATVAESKRNEAAAQLRLAHIAHARSVLRAPFSGVVLSSTAVAGLVVVAEQVAQPLVVLADPHRLRASGQLPAERLTNLSAGDAIKVRDGNRSFEGRIALVGLEPVNPGQMPAQYVVEAVFEVPDGAPPVRVGTPVNLVLE